MTSKYLNIVTVSSKWKNIGAKTIKSPLKKNNNWLKYEFLLIKNWVSSLPKWKEATIKKIINEIEGIIVQITITEIAIKIYEK